MPELHFPAGFQFGEHGDYTIIRSSPLNSDVKNSFADVFLAVKRKTRKKFAVKVLRPSVIGRFDRVIDDFQQEIRLLMILNHRYIIRIEDYGSITDAEGMPSIYLVTEYIPSGNILGRAYPFRTVVQLGVQICEGLRYLHENGVVHRDVKPDNILLAEGKIVRIMDFGIAKILGRGSPVSSVIGSPAYAAPEQIHHSVPVTERSDIYSFAKTFYSMVTDKIPQPDLPVLDLPPGYEMESWAEPLKDFFRIATAFNPEDRFAGMEECKIALIAAARRKSHPAREGEAVQESIRTAAPGFDETPVTEKSPPVRREKWKFRRLLPVLYAIIGVAIAGYIIPLALDKIEVRIESPQSGAEIVHGAGMFQKGVQLYESGEEFYPDARLIFEEITARYPRDPRPYPYLGWIYAGENSIPAAVSAWESAVRLSPDVPLYRISLGLMYHTLGRKSDACREWEKAIDLDPENAQARSLIQISGRGR